MPFSLNLYHDQIGAGGATASPLPAAIACSTCGMAASRSTTNDERR